LIELVAKDFFPRSTSTYSTHFFKSCCLSKGDKVINSTINFGDMPHLEYQNVNQNITGGNVVLAKRSISRARLLAKMFNSEKTRT